MIQHLVLLLSCVIEAAHPPQPLREPPTEFLDQTENEQQLWSSSRTSVGRANEVEGQTQCELRERSPHAVEALAASEEEEKEVDEKALSVLPLVVFVHVPKTAGLSMLLYLQQGLSIPVFHAVHPGQFLSLPQESQNRYSAVFGHFGYGLHKLEGWKLPPALRRPAYATMLRHPVSRIVSQFQFETGRPRTPTEATTADDVLIWLQSLTANRDNHTVWSAHSNPVTQQLCCASRVDAAAITGSELELCTGDSVSAATLECAKQNLVRQPGNECKTKKS